MVKIICPYCEVSAEFMTSKEFYGVDYGTNLYVCKPCDARVGTHKRTGRPLGTLADAELRQLRMKCHSKIDPIWKSGRFSRTSVYKRLAQVMELPKSEAHIGMFTKAQCHQLLKYFEKRGK